MEILRSQTLKMSAVSTPCGADKSCWLLECSCGCGAVVWTWRQSLAAAGAGASARFCRQAALRSALSPGIRRHMMVTVRGHKAQYTEGGGSKLPGQTDRQSIGKQGLHIRSTSSWTPLEPPWLLLLQLSWGSFSSCSLAAQWLSCCFCELHKDQLEPGPLSQL